MIKKIRRDVAKDENWKSRNIRPLESLIDFVMRMRLAVGRNKVEPCFIESEQQKDKDGIQIVWYECHVVLEIDESLINVPITNYEIDKSLVTASVTDVLCAKDNGLSRKKCLENNEFSFFT